MSVLIPNLAASDLTFVWNTASPEGKVILILLLMFSIVAWSTMVSKGLQMRRAKSLNRFFEAEYRQCKTVLAIKRTMNPGFAGIENELYYGDNTLMLFGDAKAVLGDVVKTLSGESGMGH